jgi:diaminopimelate epimerase
LLNTPPGGKIQMTLSEKEALSALKFSKWQGIGNDFIILDAIDLQTDEKALAVRLCDRHYGIGADGLCLLETSGKADIRMRLINADGSEAEMCGNLMRCLPKYLYQTGICRKEKLRIETLAGIIKPELLLNAGEITAVRVDMGKPRLKRGEVPIIGEPDSEAGGIVLRANGKQFTGRGISMGNPHFVVFVNDINTADLTADGPALETSGIFPAKANIEFVQVMNKTKIRMRVWERGVGVTLACGTGTCAAAAAGILDGLLSSEVEVVADGGSLFIDWPDTAGSIFMTGPAEEVFRGEIFL